MFVVAKRVVYSLIHTHTHAHVRTTSQLAGTLALHCPGGMLETLLSAHLQPLPRQSAGKEAEMVHSSNTYVSARTFAPSSIKASTTAVYMYTNHCDNALYTTLRMLGLVVIESFFWTIKHQCHCCFSTLDMSQRVCAAVAVECLATQLRYNIVRM